MSSVPEDLAGWLYRAYVDADPVDPAEVPDLTVEEGYATQRAFTERRAEAEGPVAGYKIGFTNGAVQADLGVSEPSFGRVLRGTVRDDRRVDADGLIEPMVEPEIAVVLGEDLDGSADRRDALAATRFVVPVLEVVDSRIEGWEFTAASAVADNSLAARLLPGDRLGTPDGDLALEAVELLLDGERAATGTGAAVLGHPAEAVAWLAGELPAHGEALLAGDIVTTGSMTAPVPVAAGNTVVARFGSLGSVVAHLG